MTITDWIQAISTVVLVAVTAIYVWRTHAISRSTERQADASVKMAEEMREQRYRDSLPLLIPSIIKRGVVDRILEPNEIDYGWLKTGVGIEVTWHNLGKGVAINTRLSFYSSPPDNSPGKVFFFPPRETQSLEVGGRREFKPFETWAGQWYDIPNGHHPRLEAEYQDIYERKITTVQEFRIDEQNRKAFFGELYFIVNGRRLGEEVIRHDS